MIKSLFIPLALLFAGCSYTDTPEKIVKEFGRAGIVDEDRKVIVKPSYDKVYNIDNYYGLRKVKHHERYGLIDEDGKLRLAIRYESIAVTVPSSGDSISFSSVYTERSGFLYTTNSISVNM